MEKISLENMGEYDETWLKLRIIENPKILGLGKLNLLSREKIIKDVGIIDLIMESSDGKNIFVIEAMVGEIDESHIIRSILYWINESREVRMKNFYPILIAESFNNRFFEVLYFLTNYIPFIIVQVTALALDEIDSEGNRKLELVFTDVPIKGSKSFRERKKIENCTESNWESWQKRMDSEQQKFISLLESEIENLSGELLINFNKDNLSIGLEDISKLFLSITIRKNNFILEGYLPFHWETMIKENRYEFEGGEFSTFDGKYSLKFNPTEALGNMKILNQLLMDSFKEYWRELGSPLI